MSEDMVMHFSSNSSDQSDPSLPNKIAKLEARLTGKTASSAKPQQQQHLSVWSAASSTAVKVVTSVAPGLSETSINDSNDENTGDFLIRANTKKRQKVQESNVVDHVVDHVEPQEAVYDGRKTEAETKAGPDVNKKKQGRGRGSSTGRGRGSKSNNDVSKSAPVPAVNCQIDVSDQKDFRPDGQLRNGECSNQDEEVSSLCAKIVGLEEELAKVRQDSLKYRNLCQKLENV